MHFRHTFWLQRIHCPLLINTIFPVSEHYGLVIKYTKFPKLVHKSLWHTPEAALLVGHINFFFCNQTWQGQSIIFSLKLLLKKNCDSFLWMWFNCLKVTKPLRGDGLLFTTRSPGLPGTNLVDLIRMKGWVDLGAT